MKDLEERGILVTIVLIFGNWANHISDEEIDIVPVP